jgi:hypothetical protein
MPRNNLGRLLQIFTVIRGFAIIVLITMTTNGKAIDKISALPTTMRAVQGKAYGLIDDMISVEEVVKVPSLLDLPSKERRDHMVIQVLAIALAPGDCRVLSGTTQELQGPPSLPYIPGGDCCGIVVELPDGADKMNFAISSGGYSRGWLHGW